MSEEMIFALQIARIIFSSIAAIANIVIVVSLIMYRLRGNKSIYTYRLEKNTKRIEQLTKILERELGN